MAIFGKDPWKQGGRQELLTWPQTGDEYWSFVDRWGLTPEAAVCALALGYYADRFYGLKVYIISGRRTKEHNRAVGGVENSSHLSGEAFDVSTQGSGGLPQVGSIGEQLGLRWGGRFKKYDPGHFDLAL